MKLGKTMLAIVGAACLLVALVGMASAGRLSTSETRLKATFTRLNFSGGFGTVECEAALEGAFHERTITKTVGSLTGFLNGASVTRCRSGGVTILGETLPWHVRYRSFTGTLPAISAISATISGLAFRIREPTFGVTCLVRTEQGQVIVTFNRETTGAIASVSLSGSDNCEGISGEFSGTSSSLTSNGGTRVTVSLI